MSPRDCARYKKDVPAARAGLGLAAALSLARRVIRLTWRRDPFKPPAASPRAYNWYPHPAACLGCFCFCLLYGSPPASTQARTAAACTFDMGIKYLRLKLNYKVFFVTKNKDIVTKAKHVCGSYNDSSCPSSLWNRPSYPHQYNLRKEFTV